MPLSKKSHRMEAPRQTRPTATTCRCTFPLHGGARRAVAGRGRHRLRRGADSHRRIVTATAAATNRRLLPDSRRFARGRHSRRDRRADRELRTSSFSGSPATAGPCIPSRRCGQPLVTRRMPSSWSATTAPIELLQMNISQYWKEQGIEAHDFPLSFDLSNPPLHFAELAHGHGCTRACEWRSRGRSHRLSSRCWRTPGPFLIDLVLEGDTHPERIGNTCGQ